MPPKRPVARRKPPADTSAATSAESGPAPPQQTLSGNEQPATSGQAGTDATPSRVTFAESVSESTAPSTPSRPTRLTSLNQPSIGSPTARGKATVPRPKFVGRRSQAARTEAEREQAEEKAKEQADLRKRLLKRDGRGRGGGERGARSGRGRGGYMGESDRPTSIASGPFSAGQASDTGGWSRRSAPSSGGIYLGGGGGGGGGSNHASGSRSSARISGAGIKHEDGDGSAQLRKGGYAEDDYASSDDDDGEKDVVRRDVDNLVVVDLTRDEEDPAQTLAPFRIPRQAHKDRTIGVTVDGAASSEAIAKEVANESGAGDRKKGKQRGKDIEVVGERERFHGTYSSSETDEDHIKQEPADENANAANVEVEGVDAAQEPPSSPESRRKFKEQIKVRKMSDIKSQRPALQTHEEIEEWERQQRDLDILRSELGTQAKAQDQEGDVNMENAATSNHDKRADKVYLFQFPPVLPDLLPIQVKPDPDMPQLDELTGESSESASKPTSGMPDTTANTTSATVEGQPRLPAGAVGKLRIHKSGKATLDWGGTSLTLSMGTNASFLQDVIIATMPEQKVGQGGDGGSGIAMGMGQVKGKFVVTPDWEALLQ